MTCTASTDGASCEFDVAVDFGDWPSSLSYDYNLRESKLAPSLNGKPPGLTDQVYMLCVLDHCDQFRIEALSVDFERLSGYINELRRVGGVCTIPQWSQWFILPL
jgi:hypothetical protein